MDLDREHLVELSEGVLVEQDVLRVVQKVMEYDPNIKIQYLNHAAALGDAPYRLIERCKDGEWRTIFYVWTLDDRVLDRLRAADCHSVDVLSNIDANNASLRQKEGRRFREEVMGEAKDMVMSIISSPKGRYSLPVGEDRILHIDDDPKPSWYVEEKDS